MLLTLALLALVGCAPTCDEVEGAICEDELADLLDRPEDDTGADGWAWFDQAGMRVTRDAELLWEDDAGVIWQVDPVVGLPFAVDDDGIATRPRFMSEDCTGEALVADPPPQMFAYGEYNGPIYVWIGDDIAGVERVNSYDDAGACREGSIGSQPLALWADVMTLGAIPAPGWTAPLELQPLG